MITGRTIKGTEYAVEPTATDILVSLPALAIASAQAQITEDGAALGLHAVAGGARRYIRVEVEAGHVAAIRAAQVSARRDWHSCYDHAGYNYSCAARDLECGCREHRKASLPVDGVQPKAEEFVSACESHREPEPKPIPGMCPECGSVCYGDCEAAL